MRRLNFEKICANLSQSESSIIILSILETIVRKIMIKKIDFEKAENLILNVSVLKYSKLIKDKELEFLFSMALELEDIRDLVGQDEFQKSCEDILEKIQCLFDKRINNW